MERAISRDRADGLRRRPVGLARGASLAERNGDSALDIACGNGRNALFLAELGYAVDAVDTSDVAIERVETEARRRELSIEAHRLDLETDPFPGSSYAVILNFNYLERSIFDAIRSSLVPGGLLFFQTRLHDPANDADARFKLGPNELLDAFAGEDFRVMHYHEAIGSKSGAAEDQAWAGLVARRT